MAIGRGTLCALFLVVLISRTTSAQPKMQPKEKPSPPKITPRVMEPLLSKADVDFFEKKIRPVLVHNCYKCHSGDPAKAKAHLVLDTHDGLRKGGDSGEVVAPRHPEKSLLIEAVKYEGLAMPPDGQLPQEVLADFEKWVAIGAPDPRVGKAANPKNKIDLAEAKRHWAFQHPKASPPPKVHDAKWPGGDIDHFVLAHLEKEGLKPVHDADRVTLIRRLTFDLTGLPPTPEEIDVFVKDKSGHAYANLIDRLLESPRFGERWGRHWLDVVRYAESTGKERNVPYRYAWRYRDYVIDSFNADKPYDKFIIEQLAGDLIQARNPGEHNNKSLLIATGFLAIGPKSAANNNAEQFKMDVIDDQIDVTGRAFLGMTIACARCHDHKFDPIPQTDYYAIAGIFHSTETFAGIKPGRKTATEERLLKLPGEDKQTKPDESKEEKERRQEMDKIESQLDDLHKQQKEADKKPPNLKGAKGKPPPRPPVTTTAKVDLKAVREQIKKLEDRMDELEGQATASGNLAMGVRDGDAPADFHVLVRGELKDKGPDVPRGVLTVLKTAQTIHVGGPRHSGRMELAAWIADKNNPLTARVMVNRVWEHLFGQGLVDTVDNFGALGNEPSHPELLDTLAVQFMDQKWSVKKLIRSMVLSRVYQLSSEHNDANYEKDPGDKYLWRMSRRRLDAEEIRDAMLMASGQLDLDRPEGSPAMELSNLGVGVGGKGMQEVRKPSNVRSVYLPILRGLVPAMLGAFDVADPDLIVGKRDVTTVPTQALFLMNNPFVLKQSEELAKRVLKVEGVDQNTRIDLAYRLAVGRLPTERERTNVTHYIADYRKAFEGAKQKGNPQIATWASFCQTLFQSGLFRYVY
jgi:hypothetical protein